MKTAKKAKKTKKTNKAEIKYMLSGAFSNYTTYTKSELDMELNGGGFDGGDEILEVKVIRKFKVVDRKQELREVEK